MRILVNCIACHSGGTRSVSFNLVKSLAKQPGPYEYFVLAPAGAGYEDLASANTKVLTFPRKKFYYLWRIWFDQAYIPILCKKLRIDAILNQINLPARFVSVPQFVAIHQSNLLADVSYKMPLKDWFFFKLSGMLFRFGKKSVKYFLVQTPIMANNLMSRHKVERNRIAIIKNGFEARASQLPEDNSIKERLSDPRSINAVCISCYYPSKNLEVFLEVARLARQRRIELKIFLTIEGAQHPWADRFLRQIQQQSLDDMLINLGRLGRDGVETAYRYADMLVLPTLLESFGMIYLEAMGYSCPIATSERDFASCVCGDAALYFDPGSPASILDKMLMIHNDKQLRAKLVDNGSKRLKTFFKSWDEVAGEYLDLIKSVG